MRRKRVWRWESGAAFASELFRETELEGSRLPKAYTGLNEELEKDDVGIVPCPDSQQATSNPRLEDFVHIAYIPSHKVRSRVCRASRMSSRHMHPRFDPVASNI